jgi:PIN domain nuclease of toxin-antitoxin system
LSPAARTRIEASELVFVSATSAWEVAEELTTTATPPTGSSSLRRSSTVSTW